MIWSVNVDEAADGEAEKDASQHGEGDVVVETKKRNHFRLQPKVNWKEWFKKKRLGMSVGILLVPITLRNSFRWKKNFKTLALFGQ